MQEGAAGADLATKGDLTIRGNELRAEMALLCGEMREMEQRLMARMEAMKAEIMSRMMTMILGAALVNLVTVSGAMFAAVRLLAA